MKKKYILVLACLGIIYLSPILAGQILSGDSPEVKQLREYAKKRENSETTLHVAVDNDDLEAIKLILSLSKEDLNRLEDTATPKETKEIYNQKTDQGSTVIHYAVEPKNIDIAILNELLQHPEIKLNEKDNAGYTALQRVIYDKKEEAVQAIISALKSRAKTLKNQNLLKEAIQTKTPHGDTLLSLATTGDSKNIVKMLLDTGFADPNEKGIRGITPFEIALEKDFDDIAKELITNKNGIDVNRQMGKDLRTPLHLAIENKKLGLIDTLLEKPKINLTIIDEQGRNPLHYAAQRGLTEIVEKVIDKQPSLLGLKSGGGLGLAPSQQSRTALDFALGANKLDTAKTLLKKIIRYKNVKGVDINAPNKNGKTALAATVVDLKDRDLAQELIDAGADVNLVSNHTTVLDLAVDSDMKQLLIENGGMTVIQVIPRLKEELERAIGTNKKDVVQGIIKQLIQCQGGNDGIDINFVGKNGKTMLFAAVDNLGDQELAQELIDVGAQVNIKDKEGKTPLFYSKTAEIAQVLIGAGADLNIVSRDKTALDVVTDENIKNLLIDNGAKTFAQLEQARIEKEKEQAEKEEQRKKDEEEQKKREVELSAVLLELGQALTALPMHSYY